MAGFHADLVARGLVHQVTDPGLAARLDDAREPLTVYCGFDAQRPSLQIGNLVAVVLLRRFLEAGHKVIALVGGGTSLVGDPSGKDAERPLVEKERIKANVEGVSDQLRRCIGKDAFQGGNPRAVLADNVNWLEKLNLLDFLRDVGKHFGVAAMLAKDAVRARLEDRDQGISFTEFAYQILQAYDFRELYDRHQCRLQVGGSDQWGNITAGVDLIRRTRQGQAWGLTYPLLVDSAGRKMGKTETGAVWLDPAQTSPFAFYQHFVRSDDRDVGRLLRALTLLRIPEIEGLERAVAADAAAREAHRRLAKEVTAIVHGSEEAARAEEATRGVYGETPVSSLSQRAMEMIRRHGPAFEFSATGAPLGKLLHESGLASSASEARRLLQQGGVYLNEERQTDAARPVADKDFPPPHHVAVLRRGKAERRFLFLSP